MWGSWRNNIMHIKTASDASSATLEDSNSSAAPTWHRRQSSTPHCYYYVQSPTQDSLGSTQLHQREQSLDMSRNMELLPIWDEDRDEWEKIGLEDSAPHMAGNLEERWKCPNYEQGYYSEFENESRCPVFVWVLVAFAVVLAATMVVLWGMGRTFKPRILVEDIVFTDVNIQQGVDYTGVAMEIMSLNSTVKILHKKSATFFGIHFSSSPLLLHRYGLKLGSGQMEKLYQSRKREEKTTRVVVQGHGMPLYGGELYLALGNHSKNVAKVKIGLNLTFTVRAKANILGNLISYNSFKSIRCPLTLDGALIGKPIHLTHSCIYQ